MLTRLRVRNFKRLGHADIELGQVVVLIGPNNSGKTTALQALTLWDAGLRQWYAKRGDKPVPRKRLGVAINRRDLINIPVASANLLWRDLHLRRVTAAGGKTEKTRNIRIDVLVEGVTDGTAWSCGLEFDYTNEESFICRPMRQDGFEDALVERTEFTEVPAYAAGTRVAFLPPMSGLAAVEPKWEPGRINVLLGEGQTAQVLRNLCFQIYAQSPDRTTWEQLVKTIEELFGVRLLPPFHNAARGEISMEYEEMSGSRPRLDLAASGRGLQQTLLLLAHMYANPRTVLLLDEPDAHLEILRQRETYHVISQVATRQGSQIIAASHSEVVLNEAADRDMVIAFVGTPHRIDDRGSQVLKALKEIGYEHYYQAEIRGWVLYLEGSTDLAILRAFAELLEHPAQEHLESPFVHYVQNKPANVRRHFWGLREAMPDLVGVALFDRLDRSLPDDLGATGLVWQKREIESYLCLEEVLLAYARHEEPGDLFELAQAREREDAMRRSVEEVSEALHTLRGQAPWSPDVKVTDDFLDPLFVKYFQRIGLALPTQNFLRKADYHVLARLVPPDKLDVEVREKLDSIKAVADGAQPRTG